MRIGTRAIHAGNQPDPSTGAVVAPITLSTTFERGHDFTYSRADNPNRKRLEATIASLEEANHCVAYASGMAAISSVIGLLRPGERVLSIAALYGGTFVFLNQIASTMGITVDYADELSDVQALLTPETKLVWLESPTNPTMHVTEIAALARQCRAADVLLAVDNTFSSPIITRPLTLGADFVVHSATKYLNGHADVTMGVVSTLSSDLASTLRFRQNLVGGVPSPFDCWLCQRGLKTLHLRVKQASASALQIAAMLEGHPKVKRVSYPMLPSSDYYSISKAQNSGGLGGGMLSFRLVEGADVEALCRATSLFKWAVSLGGVESLIEIPASAMTHRSMTKEQRERVGVYEDLIRISVGCEEVEDLLEDLQQALESC
ncbi:Cystathionine gamma-lyase [Taphrina deformans PYCC 5710]|uniref:cystathionine gamma-lyase n=1 Tax=Taphrina deformans (strain PYCC 5710 / ATCC 11124 / CBS 356.35 / IMI 108563 / JCM 9778 / NBRC 8474) TaxID=1097556 RepID=R4X942_TAPDE|nr:Cystathionine gamma-lyase [Taphrina deformans PYCC 5710]|eukprot:CCG81945.1 Cystathionine gamma-lyase [Taphrina deformans PYCC 5710]